MEAVAGRTARRSRRAGWAPSAQTHGDRDGEVADVRDADRQRLAKAERAGALLGASVERDRGLPQRRALDLDLLPADTAHAEAEHLRYRLFRRPPPGEAEDVAPAVTLLPFCVHAPEKTHGVPLEDAC